MPRFKNHPGAAVLSAALYSAIAWSFAVPDDVLSDLDSIAGRELFASDFHHRTVTKLPTLATRAAADRAAAKQARSSRRLARAASTKATPATATKTIPTPTKKGIPPRRPAFVPLPVTDSDDE